VFNHLPSGTYRIEVRAIDNGVVSESRVFTLVVTPPWYRSTLAYIIYALALAALILLGGWLYRRRMRQRLDEDKMKFLINATHDIRSPLTLIMGPLDKLRRRGLDAEAQEDLGVIERNAQRILSLVNQILDVRKIDKQQMHLHCRETDMAEFVRTIYQVFEYTARERGIDYTFDAPTESVKAWIDRTQFDKVVSNLLSNAFKYGSDNGEISLHLTTGHDDHAHGALKDYVELTVADIGTGMRDETLLHLFDRFYQGAGEKSGNVLGTGIGLNLCKMIVDMHHGTITGRNRTDGQRGSVFTVRLPLGTAHLDQAELDTSEETPQSVRLSTGRQPSTTFRVLIVDDDEELARFVAQELASYYYFAMSHNGKDGLKELLTNDYDLVISDVMMPEMDGFTMLRMIRTNVNISHLPVIMLTSKSDIGNRLEGLEKGADAYLTKPFNVSELHATIDNLIATRLRLRGKFSGSQKPIDKVKQIEVKGNDEQLMERIIKSVNDHLSDSDFGVDTICQDAGISRAHLHRKMKEMTGIPVSEFIRNIRMEQAARLLKEQKLNITQVAYTVGFSSLPYFSAVFRKHFGISPREFIVQQTEGGE
jgi:signal transduction histidine kinase/DNA-binding response OmpR family regulator